MVASPVFGSFVIIATAGSNSRRRATQRVAGIIALLLQVYSGRQHQQVLATTPTFVDEIGLSTHLSSHRANGLALMLERVRAFASAHASEDFAEDDT